MKQRYLNPYKKKLQLLDKIQKLRERIDYCLTTPGLIPHTVNIGHTAHNYQNTDHHTIVVTFNFTYTKKGVGIFRCPPNTHNDPNYQELIRNTIKTTIFNSIEENPNSKWHFLMLESNLKRNYTTLTQTQSPKLVNKQQANFHWKYNRQPTFSWDHK